MEKGEYNSMEGFLSYYIDVLQGKTARSFSMETSIPYDFGFLPVSPEIHPYEVSFYLFHKLTNFYRNLLTHGVWLEYPKL